MKKNSLAAALSLLVASGFAVAQSPSGEVRMSTDQNRAEQILERAETTSGSTSGNSGASDISSGGQGMSDHSSTSGASQTTTIGAQGKKVPVPDTEVRMSTDESRAEEILQRARQLSDNQQSGSMRSSSGGSGSKGSDSSVSGHSGSAISGSSTSPEYSSGTSDSGMSGRRHADEQGATSGSSAAGDTVPSGVSSPIPSGEASAFGRTGPAGEDAGSSETFSKDPSTGYGRTAPPDAGQTGGMENRN